MFSGRNIRLDKETLHRARQRARELGYASVEEYLAHLIDQDCSRGESPPDDAAKEKVLQKMKGLGYLE